MVSFFFDVGAYACLCEQKFQEIEEAHLRQMKQLIKGYSHSIEDTHVQVGQVCCSQPGSDDKERYVRTLQKCFYHFRLLTAEGENW